MSDAEGRVRFCNRAALVTLAGPDAPDDALIGRAVHEVLALLPGVAQGPQPLPSGDSVWYLVPDSLPSLRDARFAAEVGDALAGTLNLRRTLARVVDLAVPGLGRWASVTVWENDRIRQVSRGDRGGADDRIIPLGRVPDADRKWLAALMKSPLGHAEVLTPERAGILGGTGDQLSALLAAGPVTVVTAPLRAHGSTFGLLALTTLEISCPDLTGLEALARRGAVALSAARVYEERSTLADTLRSALVPPPLPTIEGICMGAAYRAAAETTEIGGDFYEVHPEETGWAFTIGDVCGKGVGAAVLTGQVRQSLHAVSLVDRDPVRRLQLLNSALLSSDGTSFVTVVHGVMRPADGGVAVRLAAGGHPAPLLRRRDGTVEEVPAHGPIVGMLPEVSFQPVELQLLEGETMLCFTDGLPDAKGPAGFLGVDRLAGVLADSEGMAAPVITERCLQTAIEHLDGRPHDDMAVMAVQVDPRL